MSQTAAAPIESVNTYVRSIDQFPRIKRSREAELADIIQHGTPEERTDAVNELVTGNLKLVVKIAHDLKYCGLGFQDLVSEGNMGLITAAKRFDPSKCPKFGAYASYWIKQSMRLAIASQSHAVRLPTQTIGQVYKIDSAKRRFVQEFGREPDDQEIAELSNIGLGTVKTIQHAAIHACSLDERIKEDDDTTFGELLSSEYEDPQDSAYHDMLVKLISEHVSKLSDRARMAVEMAFGLRKTNFGMKKQVWPVRIVAQEIGMSVKRTEEFIQQELQRLKESLESAGITGTHQGM